MFESAAMWLEQSPVARLVGESLMITASLSAVHVLGFTTVMGSALVANLRLVGLVLSQRPVVEVARPARIGIALGLLVSVTTGLLLFSTRATALIVNGTFQLKMALLTAAAVFHFMAYSRVIVPQATGSRLVVTGTVGLALWLGLALAGSALILLE